MLLIFTVLNVSSMNVIFSMHNNMASSKLFLISNQSKMCYQFVVSLNNIIRLIWLESDRRMAAFYTCTRPFSSTRLLHNARNVRA